MQQKSKKRKLDAPSLFPFLFQMCNKQDEWMKIQGKEIRLNKKQTREKSSLAYLALHNQTSPIINRHLGKMTYIILQLSPSADTESATAGEPQEGARAAAAAAVVKINVTLRKLTTLSPPASHAAGPVRVRKGWEGHPRTISMWCRAVVPVADLTKTSHIFFLYHGGRIVH